MNLNQKLSIINIYLLAVASPWLLLIAGMVLPIQFVMEEVVKLLILWNISRIGLTQKAGWVYALTAGLVFGMSEVMLFVINALTQNNVSILVERILLTVPMHGISALTMFVIGRRGKLWWAVGLAAAIVIHGTFNYIVSR